MNQTPPTIQRTIINLFSPSGGSLPVFLILGWPLLLWLWLDTYHNNPLAEYGTILLWTLEWAMIPGIFLLGQILSIQTPPSFSEAAVTYAIPLVILSTLIWTFARKWPKLQALWLALAWSFFILQITGSIPMVYLWYIGV